MTADPLRVLHVVEATTAGVRRYVTTLATGLRARGVDAAVAAPWQRYEHYGDVSFAENLRRQGISFHAVPMRRQIGPWDLSALLNLYGLLRRERFSLVHTHSSKGGFLGRMAAYACHIPVIHTPNGLYFLEKTGPGRQFYLSLERLAGHLTTAMVAVSTGEKDILINSHVVVPARIQVIHNCVDVVSIDRTLRLTRAEAKSRLGIGPDQAVIGSVGRLVSQKAPLVFVQAARRVCEQAPGTLFVWVGSGPLQAEVESQAHASGVPLRLLGHREDVLDAMRAFDVFVLASRYEGLSFSLLEAMALGLPVVATDVAGTQDVVDDAVSGLVVPVNAPLATANAILSLLRDPQQAAKLAAAGRRKVRAQFTTERMLDSHQVLYEKLCASFHRPTADEADGYIRRMGTSGDERG